MQIANESPRRSKMLRLLDAAGRQYHDQYHASTQYIPRYKALNSDDYRATRHRYRKTSCSRSKHGNQSRRVRPSSGSCLTMPAIQKLPNATLATTTLAIDTMSRAAKQPGSVVSLKGGFTLSSAPDGASSRLRSFAKSTSITFFGARTKNPSSAEAPS
jgi:hypothetical protein